MIVLGLDIATNSGWAYSKGRDASDITSGKFKAVGDSPQAKMGSLTRKLHQLIKSNPKPDLCVVEAPMTAGPNPTTLAFTNRLCGAVGATLVGYSITSIEVRSSTWRKTMYGFGTRKGWSPKDWKKHAIEQVQQEYGFDVKDDEAEAIWLSQYGFTTQTFKQLVAA